MNLHFQKESVASSAIWPLIEIISTKTLIILNWGEFLSFVFFSSLTLQMVEIHPQKLWCFLQKHNPYHFLHTQVTHYKPKTASSFGY